MSSTVADPPASPTPAAPSPDRRPQRVAVLAAGGLLCTAAALWFVLPASTIVANWAVAWSGFDAGLAVLSLLTAVLLHRRDPRAVIAVAGTATLLLADAWFDVTTASSTAALGLAIAEAVLVEVPLAVVAIRFAHGAVRSLAAPGRKATGIERTG